MKLFKNNLSYCTHTRYKGLLPTYSLKKATHYIISGFFYVLILLLSTPGLTQQRPSPFTTRDESPFSLIYGLPIASPASLLKNKQSRWSSSLSISNTLNTQSSNNESLLIDVESLHVNLLYDYGFNDNWMLRVQLPYISYSGGFLDSAIDAYHQALGLPESSRPNFPSDQININVSLNNQAVTLVNSAQKALGDVSIQVAWQAQHSENIALSYWTSLKLPTGNEDKLTGSGGTDIASWAAMDYRLSDTRWLYGQGGVLYMGDSKILQNIQINWAAFATAGIKFQPWNSIQLKAQFDFHSALYDSELTFFDHVIQITFGGSYIANKKHSVDFSIAEDIKSASSPDVTFNMSWIVNLF